MRMIGEGAGRRNGNTGLLQRNMRVVLVIGLLALGIWIIHGFMPALIWAAILVVALWPTYSRACRAWPGGQSIALPALFTTAAGLVIIAPLVLIAFQVGREAHDFFQYIHGVEQAGIPVPVWMEGLPITKPLAEWWSRNLASPFDSNEVLHHINRATLVSATREYGAKVVHQIVIFAFTLLTLFFLFKNGNGLAVEMLEASHRLFGTKGEHIARQMVASIHGTVDGLVLVGIGEGVVLGIAYHFTGVSHPVLLGAVTAVAAMIPFGAVMAFGGASLFLLAQGSIGLALFVFALGLVVLGIADHLIRPAVIGGATELPFVWVLLGILGGVETFGLLGLFLGPAVMSALILLWRELVAKHIPDARSDLAA